MDKCTNQTWILLRLYHTLLVIAALHNKFFLTLRRFQKWLVYFTFYIWKGKNLVNIRVNEAYLTYMKLPMKLRRGGISVFRHAMHAIMFMHFCKDGLCCPLQGAGPVPIHPARPLLKPASYGVKTKEIHIYRAAGDRENWNSGERRR